MLDVENHDGLLTFLLGMIFLVLAGVGLSLVADRVSDSGKIRSGIRSQTEQQEGEILKLQMELNLKHFQLEESEALVAGNLENAAFTELSVEAIQSRSKNLSLLKSSLEASIERDEEAFRNYRIKARELAWARVIGDSLGNLKTSDGRMFHDAIVAGVDDKGISIRHSTGAISIPATALPVSCWDIFQWERPEPMPGPKTGENRLEFQNFDLGSSHAKGQGVIPEDKEDIATLRAALELAGENATRLAEELRNIRDMKSRSRSSSVPGSLDTWLERKAQLVNALADAKMQYAKARANLMIRYPDDPLLGKNPFPW